MKTMIGSTDAVGKACLVRFKSLGNFFLFGHRLRRIGNHRILSPIVLVALAALACTRTPSPGKPGPSGPAKTPEAATGGLLSLADAAAGLALKPPPAALAWSPDGSFLTWLEPGPDGLNQLVGFDVRSRSSRVLARPLDLVPRIEESEAEKAMRERRRQASSGIMQYFWFPDGRRVLVPVARELVIITPATAGAGAERLLPADHPDLPRGAPLLDVRLSPDGGRVSFTCAGNLYLLTVETKALVRVTSEGSATRFFGLAEFAAQEEMDRHDGVWWSPDGASLAFADVDESGVMIRERPDLGEKSASIVSQRYPSAGTPNAVVKLRYLRSDSPGSVGAWELGSYEYLARVHWLDPGTVLVATQDRAQRLLHVWRCTVGRAPCEELFTERDEAFIELGQDFARIGEGAFLWSTENPSCWRKGAALGRKTLFVLGVDGPRRGSSSACGGDALPVPRAELKLPEGVTFAGTVAVSPDGARVVVSAFAEKGRERRLYLWTPDDGTVRRLGPPEATWITAKFSPDFTHFSAQVATADTPEETALFALDGARVHTVVPRVEVPRRFAPVDVDVPLGAGVTLNGQYWSPPKSPPAAGRGSSSGRVHPAIIYVYGGPHGHMVQRRITRNHLWCRAMADAGFHVLMVDGRGGMYRDRAFAKAPHLRFGVYDVEDVRAAVSFLKTTPGVDPKRIGLWGWSYGGYLAVAALFRDTGLAAAAAVAPPVDWRLYDTHYTERYLGHPGMAPAAYERSSVLTDPVPGLPLLIIHGMSDDNVLLINSLQLIQRLQAEVRTFDLMLYPGRAHSLWGGSTRTHLLLTIVRFFERNL